MGEERQRIRQEEGGRRGDRGLEDRRKKGGQMINKNGRREEEEQRNRGWGDR